MTILGKVLKGSNQPLVVNLRIIQIRFGAFNEGCEVEPYAKYNVANNSHFTFCFNSMVESLACLVMKILQLYTAAENCKQEKSAKKLI